MSKDSWIIIDELEIPGTASQILTTQLAVMTALSKLSAEKKRAVWFPMEGTTEDGRLIMQGVLLRRDSKIRYMIVEDDDLSRDAIQARRGDYENFMNRYLPPLDSDEEEN